jgi:hypothetical protein
MESSVLKYRVNTWCVSEGSPFCVVYESTHRLRLRVPFAMLTVLSKLFPTEARAKQLNQFHKVSLTCVVCVRVKCDDDRMCVLHADHDRHRQKH